MSGEFVCPIEPVAMAVLQEFLGPPNRALSSSRELRWGSKGSVAVDIEKNVWQDHEDQTGGGVLDLLRAFRGYEKPEALEWLQEQGLIERRERPGGRPNGSNGSNGSIEPRGKFAGFMDHWPVATYQYHDDKGRLAYEVLKFSKDAPRRYMQRRPHPGGGWVWGLQGGIYGKTRSGDWFRAKAGKHYDAEEHIDEAPRWLYRRDEVLMAKDDGRPVVLVEGEKDAETVRGWGLAATTNAGGAKYWHESFDKDLAGTDVIVCHDNDDTGRQRAMVRGAGLHGKAASVRVLDLALHWPEMPAKADVSDWAEAGNGDAEKFGLLLDGAPLWRPARPKSRFGAFTWQDVGRARGHAYDYVIDEWLPERGRSIVGGPSQSGKSFLAIHASMCVARGEDFFDWPSQRGGVIYQAGEGGFAIQNRFLAYKKHFSVADDADVPIAILPAKVDLFSRDGDTDALIGEIKAWALTMSHPLRLIVIDTLATATIGADENSGRDMSLVLANIAKIEEETRCHVMLVHHMNADGSKLRGHTSIHANVDTVVTVTCDDTTRVRTARLAKQKDGEDGKTVRFTLASVPVGYNERTERDVTSCVVLTVNEKERLKREQERQGFAPNPTERRILMNLFDATDRHGKFVATDKDGPKAAIGHIIINWEYYRDVALERMPEIENRDKARDQVRKEFSRAKDALVRFGIIGLQHPHMWWKGKPIRGFPKTFERGQNRDISGTFPGQSVETLSPGELDILEAGDSSLDILL